MSSPSSVTDGSSIGDCTDDDAFLQLKVEIRYAGSGATFLRCNYDAASATVDWLFWEIQARQLVPAGTHSMCLSTIPRRTHRAPRIMTEPSRMLKEVWDEESMEGEYDETLLLQIAFIRDNLSDV